MTDIPFSRAADMALNWYKSDEGHSGGSFVEAVFGAATIADVDNLAALEREFPHLIRAFRMGREETNGLNKLRLIAKQTDRMFA